MTKTILFAGIILGAVLISTLTFSDAFAAVDMFIKIEGVDGESKKPGHQDEIDVLSWSWGMSQTGSFHVGGGDSSGKVNVQDFSFTKDMGQASPQIMMFCCQGEHLPDATLTLCRTADSGGHCYLEIKFTDLIISSVSYGGTSGEDILTENVSLNFAKVEMKYHPQEPDDRETEGVKEFSQKDLILKGKKILEN